MTTKLHDFLLAFVVLGIFIFCETAQAQTLAFPGAEGFGRFAKGGRGGKVIEVTNLNDSGAGSLRAALKASGPRTVVFRVGGTITLKSKILIREPFLTIAAQTAPGDGILIKGRAVEVRAHHVIIRFLRVRTGISGADPTSQDTLSVVRDTRPGHPKVENVIIDHCSLSWAEDENVAVWGGSSGVSDVTYQWCTIGESLNAGAKAGRGFLIGGGATNVSLYHNLIISNWDRSPLVQGGNFVDVVYNVIYNFGGATAAFWPVNGTIKGNYIGNYFKPGPQSPTYAPIRLLGGGEFNDSSSIFLKGNIHPDHRPNLSYPETLITRRTNGEPEVRITDVPHNFHVVGEATAFEAKERVLAFAGAILPGRDQVDTRYVQEVTSGTGPSKPPTNPGDVGGYPLIKGGTPKPDWDKDGMPDIWEELRGLNPKDPSDGPKDSDGDGFTNLEDYLNGLVNAVMAKDDRAPVRPKDLRFIKN